MDATGPAQRVGGHVVPEGVLVRSRHAMAIAVRRPSGEIVVRERLRRPAAHRGLELAESLAAWARALDFAAAQQGPLAAAAIGHGAVGRPRTRRALRWRLMMYRGALDRVLAAHAAGCPPELAAVRAHAASQRLNLRAAASPARLLRQLLCRPPTDEVLEVALVALRCVLARGQPGELGPPRRPRSFLRHRLVDACARAG